MCRSPLHCWLRHAQDTQQPACDQASASCCVGAALGHQPTDCTPAAGFCTWATSVLTALRLGAQSISYTRVHEQEHESYTLQKNVGENESSPTS